MAAAAQVGEPAQPVARRHRAHEHALVLGIDVDPRAVAQQRAAACAATTGRPRSRRPCGPPRAKRATSAETSVDLPTPGGPVSPITSARGARPGGIEQRQRRLVCGRRLDRCQRPRERRLAALRAARRSGSLNAPAWPCSAACAAARRAIGTR